jgi:hypothetical protein
MSVAVWVVLAVVVALGVVMAAFGWDRDRNNGQAPKESSRPTGEVFIDPASGRSMRVWYDPSTGEREYRPD